MVRGQYIAGTGMLLQRRLMENITHNITNADTTGYKKQHLVSHSFDDVMIQRINDVHVVGQSRIVGPFNFGTQIDQLYINFETGAIDGTERSTDIALVGDVFFVVGTPEGERYTRCGAFYIDSAGYLVDGEGNYLLGENGNINVGGPNFVINDLGYVQRREGDTLIPVDRIRVASFADYDNGDGNLIPNGQLRKQGDNLYRVLDGEAPEAQTKQYRMMQGYLETSNVDIGREMVDMLTVYRTYETNQRMLTMIDEIAGKAVNEIGRLR